jgi:hypothetical protein
MNRSMPLYDLPASTSAMLIPPFLIRKALPSLTAAHDVMHD